LIIARQGVDLTLVTQGDHAHLAAEFLGLCRIPALLDSPHRDQILRAVREHDNGWRELDAAPPFDPEAARPYSFRTIPDDARRQLWTRGCERHRDTDPLVAALIVEHARQLHESWLDAAEWSDWWKELEELSVELAEELELTSESLAESYHWLSLADSCSLAVCEQRPDSFVVGDIRVRSCDDSLFLDPFPLAGATSFELRCRRIPDRRYRNAVDFGRTLVTARWATRNVRFRPETAA
jgi:hypothetical protein